MSTPSQATVIITNAKVWGHPSATSVAVAGEHILAVGTADDTLPLAGASTRVIDAAGRSLLPGFHDSHIHPVMGTYTGMQCDLGGSHVFETYLERIAEYAQSHDGPWIIGGGWLRETLEHRDDVLADLDRLTGDRPVFLVEQGQHDAWVNSAALRIAGVDEHTPDPDRGRIGRNAAGRLNGWLHETAMVMVRRHLPPPTIAFLRQALRTAQANMLEAGITRFHDAVVGFDSSMPVLAAYLEEAHAGGLHATASLALRWDRERGIEQVDDIAAAAAWANEPGRKHSRVRVGTVKIFQDGVCDSHTAALKDPYSDEHGQLTGDNGILMLDRVHFADAVRTLGKLGLDVHTHAIGDRAISDTLDAFADARASQTYSHSLRHQMAHLHLTVDEDLGRFSQEGVTANIQPRWAHPHLGPGHGLKTLIGSERATRQYRFRSLADAGAKLAIGSDWPVTTFNPFEIMQVAITRADPYVPERGTLDSAQKLTLYEAVTAYTEGSAYANHMEHEVGRIVPGFAADLVLASDDIESMPETELYQVKVDVTVAAGNVVFERD